MKRALVVLSCASVTLAIGCSGTYETRVKKTIEDMKYRQLLDQHLNPPAQDKFKELGIFLRTPKPLVQSSQFLLTSEPGKYDLETSFFNQATPDGTLRLHVLARRKQAKGAATKKGAAPPPDTSNRGPFQTDVLSLLASNFGAAEALQAPKIQNVNEKRNTFKRLSFATGPNNDVTVSTYLYNRDPYDVALVWYIPKGVSTTGIRYSLETFAVGPKAMRQFEGGVGDEEAGAKGAEGGGGVF